MKLLLEENRKNYKSFVQFLTRKRLLNGSKNYNHWGNIPIEVEYLEPLYNIYEEGKSLIDLGCGAGNVLRYAKNIGFKVKGIEFNEDFKGILKHYDVDFIDIRNMDLTVLSNFDVVYCYKPLKKGMSKFLIKIKENMKQNAVLITPYINTII